MKTYPLSRISISKRLPILICTLLIIGTVIFGLISYVGVKRASLKIGQERLLALTDQLSSMYPNSAKAYIGSTKLVAADKAVKRFIQTNGADSVAEATISLQKLRQDTLFVQVDLLDANRKTILHSAKEGVDIKIPADTILPISAPLLPDSGISGKIYAVENAIYYPVIVTVTDRAPGSKSGTIIGYIVRWRSMNATSQALEQLSKLLGTGAKLYIGNDDGTLWTDMITTVSAPPVNKKDANSVITYSRAKNEPVIAAIRPIANTHWLLSIELSQQKVLEAARRFLFWIIIAAAIMLILGFVAAWIMSNSITRPLQSLTHAASAIASGNYSTIVEENRYDELGKLSRAFNAMALQVKNSQMTLEKKMQEYRFLFERNPMPMWVISRSTLEVIDVNEAAITQYGYSREEFLQLNAAALRPKEDIEKYLSYAKYANEGKAISGIWRHKKKDGTIIMVEVTADDIIYKDIQARLVLAHDVTQKLEMEEKQKKYTEELKSSNTELERFAYIASHDLQEPLRMVSSFLNLLEEEYDAKLDATGKEYIHYAVDGSRRMKILVNDLLLYSRVGTNKEKFADIDLNEVMSYVLRVLDEEIKKSNAVVNVKKLPAIVANKTLISQLFINLVANALKYHGEKPPEIEIGFTDETGKYIFYVKDCGIGIDPKYFDKIFIIFQRLHSKGEYPGTGIGLAICKKIVEVHKGEIWVRSEEGKGSTFYFSILKNTI